MRHVRIQKYLAKGSAALRHGFIGLTAVLLLAMLGLPVFSNKQATALSQTKTLNASVDTHVQNSSSTTNYGSSTFLTGSSSDARAFMRWDTNGQVASGSTLTGVKLRMYVTNISVTTGGAEIHPATNTWQENTLTWANQPTWNASVLATSQPAVANAWLEVNIPVSSVNLSGDTNFGLRYTASGSNFRFASSEATANYPQLVLTYDPPQAEPQPPVVSQLNFTATHDSYVKSGAPTANYGSDGHLWAGSTRDARTYVKWPTQTTLPAGATVKAVKVRVNTAGIAVTTGGYAVRVTTDAWTESAITWNNQPALATDPIATSAPAVAGQWTEIDLPISAFVTSGNTNLVFNYSVSSSMARFNSSETNLQPQLVVTIETPATDPDPTPTDPTTKVLMAAGDIACRPGLATTPTVCRHGEVSDLVLGQNPDAVAVVGDTQYDTGTLAEFLGSYDPTWGRFKNITYPVPGNHEYTDAAGGAKGYFDYWNGVGNNTGRAGDRSKGYYSYDLGNWHVVVINSECGYVGGCGVGSAQYNWLQQDLANNNAVCTLAYTHHPRFTSHTGYANDTVMGDMWNLMVGDVDVMLAGHQHALEIYKKIGTTPANSAIPVLSNTGIKQFIVGTGGRSHYTFTGPPTAASTGGTAMESRDDKTFGALKLTLKATSYDWSMLALPGSAFHNADSGTTGGFAGSETCN